MSFWIFTPPPPMHTQKSIEKNKKLELSIPKSYAGLFHKCVPGMCRCSTKLSPQLPWIVSDFYSPISATCTWVGYLITKTNWTEHKLENMGKKDERGEKKKKKRKKGRKSQLIVTPVALHKIFHKKVLIETDTVECGTVRRPLKADLACAGHKIGRGSLSLGGHGMALA